MIDLITGHQGMAHITAEQISDINNAMMDGYGVDKVMRLDGGDVTLDGLSLVIEVGYWRVNGFDMEIKEEETLYFDPTVAGVSRIDDVYVEILQDITDGYQRAVLVIVQGEPDVSPVAPDEPTTPELNTDILLQIVHVARCTISSGAMTVSDKTIVYKYVSPEDLTSITIKGSTNNTGSTITSGTYFYLNGDLVKAKTSIANGATLTLNTNYEVVTAGGLNELNNEISALNSALTTLENKPFKYSQSLGNSTGILKITCENTYQFFFIVGQKGLMMSITEMNGSAPEYSFSAKGGLNVVISATATKKFSININNTSYTSYIIMSNASFTVE